MHKSRTAGLLRLRAAIFVIEVIDGEQEVEHPRPVRPRRQALPYAIVLFMAVVSHGLLLKFSMSGGERT